jgi:hypothetical protein
MRVGSMQKRPVLAMSKAGLPSIKLIASDVDGTLLNHKQVLTESVERAVKLASSVGVQVCKSLHTTLA